MKAMLALAGIIAVAAAEIGLIVQSSLDEINGLPVRIVDSRLTIKGDGPLFQGDLDAGSLVLSDRVVSEEAAGSGIGLDADGLLVVTFNSSTSFEDRDGWLEYKGQGIFGLKQNGRSYDIYAGRADLEDSQPALFELAALKYPDANSNGTTSRLPGIANTVIL